MAFARYLDSWVVDRVMFEFVNQGGCNCCGFTHGGMGMTDFMALCSDVETDDGKTEKTSPWPQFMQDEVWSDRVKFRRMLKDSMGKYRDLFETHGDAFVTWWLSLDAKERGRCFQMPKDEVQVQFETTYEFKTAYQVVMCSVMTQVENFPATKYSSDGGTDCEIYLETSLRAQRGAWTVSEEYFSTDKGCDMFFGMLMQLGGDHLLPKRSLEMREMSAKAKVQAAEKDEDNEERKNSSEDGQSFRGDRRLVRLLIFRYFADMAWSKFTRTL